MVNHLFLPFLCTLHNTINMNKNNPLWFRDRIGYIIYPSSFYDSNGDGIGDIPGIISKLDYLKDLGINLVWICPFFDSPMDDNGYDVRDYLHVDPRFGTDEDFKKLIQEAHARDIAVVIDFVLNHTSDEHPWFIKALEDPNSKERGYYYIRKGKYVNGELVPPNNWKGFFSTSVWDRIGDSDEFYMHIFSSKMPDVNWSNPELREEYIKIANTYMDWGVDGLRLDAVAHLSRDMSFADSDKPADPEGLVYDTEKYSNRPEIFDYLREMKERVFLPRQTLTIGEAGGGITAEQVLKLADRETGCINMVFHFDAVWCDGSHGSIDKTDEEVKTDVKLLKRTLLRWYEICGNRCEMPVYWCNHDHARVMSMYGDIRFRNKSAKALMTLLLFMYGVPFIYQGDELGVSNLVSSNPEDFFCDVNAKNEIAYLRRQGYDDEKIAHYMSRTSRINSRQPMPWNKGPFGGFSTSQPCFPSNQDYLEGVNVEDEERDADSVLHYAKEAIALRKQKDIASLVQDGRFELLDYGHADVFAYMHHGEYGKLIVIASMIDHDCYFGFYWTIRDVLLRNYDDTIYENHVFKLRPFECLVLKV